MTIDTLPIKLFYNILESGEVGLLKVKDAENIWNEIYEEFQKRDNNPVNNRIFRIQTDIEYLQTKYNLILMCVDSLRFEPNDDLISILKVHGYNINDKEYMRSLEYIERNANGIVHKIKLLENQMPKIDNDKKDKSTIDDVLAAYSSILGFNIGNFNEITCSEYLGWKKQVETKIKNQEKQLQEIKSKKNGR